MDDSLNTAKARIRAAFESGIRMTTAQGNRIGKTVDFRKIVSLLKSEGFDIQSYWNERTGGVGKPTTTNTRCRRKGHA